MVLDELITALNACPTHDAAVEIDGKPAGEFDSYRGYYEQLALGTGLEPITVGELLQAAADAKGATFEGYKGGQYTMTGDTPIWFAEHGFSSGIAIIGIDSENDPVKLLTADIGEYA